MSLVSRLQVPESRLLFVCLCCVGCVFTVRNENSLIRVVSVSESGVDRCDEGNMNKQTPEQQFDNLRLVTHINLDLVKASKGNYHI